MERPETVPLLNRMVKLRPADLPLAAIGIRSLRFFPDTGAYQMVNTGD